MAAAAAVVPDELAVNEEEAGAGAAPASGRTAFPQIQPHLWLAAGFSLPPGDDEPAAAANVDVDSKGGRQRQKSRVRELPFSVAGAQAVLEAEGLRRKNDGQFLPFRQLAARWMERAPTLDWISRRSSMRCAMLRCKFALRACVQCGACVGMRLAPPHINHNHICSSSRFALALEERAGCYLHMFRRVLRCAAVPTNRGTS